MNSTAIVERQKQLNLKLHQEEIDRLGRLAAHHALTPQSMLRMLLKKACDDFEASQPKPRGKR